MSLLKNPSHPGEVLNELYLEPLSLSAIALAKSPQAPRTRIERLLKGETSLSADTAMRLAKFFSTTPEY
jgi:antitoxin HigA-1